MVKYHMPLIQKWIKGKKQYAIDINAQYRSPSFSNFGNNFSFSCLTEERILQ